MAPRISSEDALLDAAAANPQTEGFAWFTLDMRDAKDPQTGEPLCPSLAGKMAPQPLWNITSNGGRERDKKREDKAEADALHAGRVATLAGRVAAGLPCFDDPSDEGEALDPAEDEWSHFWGGESPTEKLAHTRDDETPPPRYFCLWGRVAELTPEWVDLLVGGGWDPEELICDPPAEVQDTTGFYDVLAEAVTHL